MWGTGASSTQCEGAAPASDWWDWEREGRAPVSGDGNGFADRFADDFAALAELGLTHHRLSLEWARLEPEEGRHDDAAVSHYRDVLLSAREAGVTPWVCLHHFTLPRWFARLGGFLVERNRTTHWRRHVDFVAETFGDLVGGWQPVNETNYYARCVRRPGLASRDVDDSDERALGGGEHPPGHRGSGRRAARRPARRWRRSSGSPARSRWTTDPRPPPRWQPLQAVNWDAGIGLFRDGVLRDTGRHPIERPDLAGCFDLLGFSYYATIGVAEGKVVPYPVDAARSPLGYGIDPGGLDLVLSRLHEQLPGTPLTGRRVRRRYR